MSNTFGRNFRVTTFGESHGKAVGVVIDGCPAGLMLSEEDVQPALDRRRPGQSDIVTPRDEKDRVEIFSGVFEGQTTGTPIMMMVKNEDQKSRDYSHMKDVFRPSHADFTYAAKYGKEVRDYRGGGRSSARVTLSQVAAGAVAQKYLAQEVGYEVVAYVQQVGAVVAEVDRAAVGRSQVEAHKVRCPDAEKAVEMEELIKKMAKEGDTVGGIVECVVRGVPVGLGAPVFNKLNADLGAAMLGINAVKGFEIGSGFAGSKMRGSEHNDEFYNDGNGVKTRSNHAGGVLGGISNGEDIYFRVAFKPVATIMKDQKTVDKDGADVEFRAFGRHDSCVVPRAVPIVEAMASLVIMDHYLAG